MRTLIGLLAATSFLLAGGCSSNKNEAPQASMKKVSKKQAAEMEARRNVFETSEDPPHCETPSRHGQLAESRARRKTDHATRKRSAQSQAPNAWYRLAADAQSGSSAGRSTRRKH